MRNQAVMIVVAFVVLTLVLGQNPAKAAGLQFPNQDPGHHVAWVTQSLKRMETIHVGMTRARLLTVFTEEGGISTRDQQEFVYQGCPYFKVDVTFKPVGKRKPGPLFEIKNPADIITKISRPYLQWSINN